MAGITQRKLTLRNIMNRRAIKLFPDLKDMYPIQTDRRGRLYFLGVPVSPKTTEQKLTEIYLSTSKEDWTGVISPSGEYLVLGKD